MIGVLGANLKQQRIVLEEFQRVIGIRRVSRLAAIKSIRDEGGLISYQNMKKVKTGVFRYVPNTYLNILSRYCGYEDFVDLCVSVRMREEKERSSQ